MTDNFKFIHGVKQHLTKADRLKIKELLAHEIPHGYSRTIYKCNFKHCDGRIQSLISIPYGLSQGGGQNRCHCNLTQGGWPHHNTTLKIGYQPPN